MSSTFARLPFLLLLIALLTVMPSVLAQDETRQPDLTIPLPPQLRIDEANAQITVRFTVYNKGGPTDSAVEAALIDRMSGDYITRDVNLIPQMSTGQTAENLELTFDMGFYPGGSTQQIILSVGSETLEGTQRFQDNQRVFSVNIPMRASTSPQQRPTAVPSPAPTTAPAEEGVFNIPLLDVEIDLNDSRTRWLLAGIAALTGIIVWAVIRLMIGGRPAFGNWQPPYANMPPLDPNTNYGRRQQWQQYAQNNVVPQPCKPGTILPRKVLLGMDGEYLSGWRITSIRMTQYDMYGRVSRSQVLARRGEVRRIDRTAQRAHTLNVERLAKRVRPVARSLTRQFKGKINRRSAMLAIALDVRLKGSHGEVRIIFELYECQNGHPQRLDQWEPEMTVLGKTIYESYTYTIFGQYGGETYRNFKKRLAKDVEGVLVSLVQHAAPANGPSTSAQSGPSAASLSSTQPMQNDIANDNDLAKEETPDRAQPAYRDDDAPQASEKPTTSSRPEHDDDEIQL